MSNYQNLEVWKMSFSLCIDVHRLCKQIPRDEQFSIAEQMRRCSLSIPSNIAEGKGRFNDKETKRFCFIALGSATELQTQLMICSELNLVDKETIRNSLNKLESVMCLLTKFIQFLDRQIPPSL